MWCWASKTWPWPSVAVLKHRTGTADGAALQLKITSLPDKMTAIWLLYGEQLHKWVNPNRLSLHPVPMAGTPHPTHQENISLAHSPLLFLPSVPALYSCRIIVTIFYPHPPLPQKKWKLPCCSGVTVQRFPSCSTFTFLCPSLCLRAALPPYLLNHRSALSDGCSVWSGTHMQGASRGSRRMCWLSICGTEYSRWTQFYRNAAAERHTGVHLLQRGI